MSKPFQPTAEQLALSAARKLRKQQQVKEPAKPQLDEEKGSIPSRSWLVLHQKTGPGQRLKVMSWNLLAQTLIRRSLFPTSDCLKAGQREHMLYREIQSHNADICCMQEVDRTEKLFPVLNSLGYSHVYAIGPGKKHGCLIAFRKDAYRSLEEKMLEYDLQDVRQEGETTARRGSSFKTRNIGSIVALQRVGSEGEGVIVATTHLFWHPSYTYERARQASILFREVAKFREDTGHHNWPCIIAGDFNFQPDDAAYSLIVGDTILPAQESKLASSRVVHFTIDPAVPATSPKDEEDEEGGSSDLAIVNARPALPADGLLSTSELIDVCRHSGTAISVYDRGQRLQPDLVRQGLTFGSRIDMPATRLGAFEPVYTSYTHYWKTVLDYIFVIDPPEGQVCITGLTQPHHADTLIPGIPRLGVCGSDHVSLSAELFWPSK